MNEDLLALYKSRLSEIDTYIQRSIEWDGWKEGEVSKPFFMKVENEYTSVATKILFVGRETFGWGAFQSQDEADSLMDNYQIVSLSGGHFNSPFWWFREEFSRRMGITESFMKATLWTNLSKIDVSKKRPTGQYFGDLSQNFISLLVEEIAIVKPDVVLILTRDGHYIWHLNNYRWIKNEPFSRFGDPQELVRETIVTKKIEQLIAPGRLPTHTYQICHPNVLRRRKGGYKNNAEELIQMLTQQIVG